MKKPRTILALPFEDAALVPELKSEYPEAQIRVLRKQEIAGLSVSSLLRKVRENRTDLIAASLRHSTVRRTASMTELLLSSGKAGRKIYFDAEGKSRQVTWLRIILILLPKLAIGSALGLLCVFMNHAMAAYFSSRARKETDRNRAESGRGTVLFLRTDLAGSLPAGGSVTHVKGIIQGFLRLGYKVVYIGDANSGVLPEDVEQVTVKPVRLLDFFDEFQLAAYNIQIALRSAGLTRRYRPAIVYQRLSAFNFSGGMLARKIHVPMILEANASEVWAKKNWSRLLFERTAIRCESTALRLASRISTVSEAAREQMEQYRIPASKFVVVPNGVDPDEFNPSVDGSPVRARYGLEGSIVVGFIGTFTKWHGVETLFDAALIAAARDSRLKFLMIGDGELRLELQNKAMTTGPSDLFVFTGLIPHSEAPVYLAACDIMVSPHLGFADGTKFFGSPTKLFEYMAMGKPIIASKLEQIGDIIEDGKNGLLMTPGNPAELAEKIADLTNNPGLRQKLGDAARNECFGKYTWEANVAHVVDRLR